jgi:hypothetical protein
LRARLVGKPEAALVETARAAVELTNSDQADHLVTIPHGATLAAGTLVEILDLDELLDDGG